MIYLLKVNIAIALFYAFYKLLLGRDTFFAWRRAALFAFIVLSIAIPAINISEWLGQHASLNGIANAVYAGLVLPEVVAEAENGAYSWTASIMNWGIAVYFMVVAVLLVRFMVQLLSILRLSSKSKSLMLYGVKIRLLTANIAPFSFFKLIFINPDEHKNDELQEILSHEKAHVDQWHSVDVILGELVCVAFWYNPFMWLTKREIRNNLEYLADNRVLCEGYNTKSYQYHLLGLTYQKAAVNLYNNFNVLPLKERIKMMNKKRTNGVGRAKYLLLLPLVTLLMIGSNFKSAAQESVSAEPAVESASNAASDDGAAEEMVYKVAEEIPEFPGGNSAMMKYLSENIQYPAQAIQEKIKGRVVVQFVVKSDGSIGEVKVLRSVHQLLDAEAVRLIKSMPKWKPGKVAGKAASVWFTVPITFSLYNGK